jgi:hypothetical protein
MGKLLSLGRRKETVPDNEWKELIVLEYYGMKRRPIQPAVQISYRKGNNYDYRPGCVENGEFEPREYFPHEVALDLAYLMLDACYLVAYMQLAGRDGDSEYAKAVLERAKQKDSRQPHQQEPTWEEAEKAVMDSHRRPEKASKLRATMEQILASKGKNSLSNSTS